jgi:hypothetical protein
MNKYYAYATVCFFCVISSPVNAWGTLGHQVVCDIAWQASSAQVKAQLQMVAKRMGYKTFAQSCVWADTVKSDSAFDHLKPLHYINVLRSQSSVAGSPCLSRATPQCVVTAIDAYYAQAQRGDLSQLHRDQALLLFSHWVGDVHQPLHVSYKDDRGGTARYVIFSGKLLSLHYLWDTALLYCQQGQPRSWRTLGRQLYHRSSGLPVEPLSVALWANESLAITQQIYTNLSSKKLPDTYCEQYSPIAKRRLQLAGRRLATLLAQMLVP